MEQKLLTYGLFEDKLKHVSEVANGLACKCFCAKCKQPLVAKNNPINSKLAHFAHYSEMECKEAYETTMHLLAKSILFKTKQLWLPDFIRDTFSKKGKLVTFDEVITDGERVKTASGTIIPDSIGKINGKELFIEFAKTHFVDEIKKEIIKKSKISCVEIDLTEQLLDETSLITFFKSSNPSIYWINNPRREKEYKIEIYKQKLEKQHKEKEDRELLRLERLREKERRSELLEKLKNYKSSKTERILIRTNDRKVNFCPKKFEALNQLKSHNFYKHDILKRIIDGEFWNGELYGFGPNGRYIFLNKEKIAVYPSQKESVKQTEKEREIAKTFFAGLMEINRIISQRHIGDCRNCQFSVDHIEVDDKDYEICKHAKFKDQPMKMFH